MTTGRSGVPTGTGSVRPAERSNFTMTNFEELVGCALHRYGTLVVWLAAIWSIAGCTPSHHRLRAYRDDRAAARVIEERAIEVCRQQRGADAPLPPHPFTSDGCSAFPDRCWVDCCVEHDMAYWCGGTMADRCAADRKLRQCVTEKTNGAFATMMYVGVRAGGLECLPFPWRWGYGWDWLDAP